MTKFNAFSIHGWMLQDLNLSGNDLLLYAFLYHNTEFTETYYAGSLQNMSDELNIGKTTVKNVLDRLVKNDLVIKNDLYIKGVKISSFSVNNNILVRIPNGENASRDNNTCSIDNIYVDNYEHSNTEEKKLSTKKEHDDLFESCWLAYRRKGSKKEAKLQWNKLNDEESQKVKIHIPYYVNASSERKYQKDFVRYLRDRIFETPVYKNNQLVYDPEDGGAGAYHPYGNNSIIWSDVHKHYIIMSPPEWGVADGYKDDERPQGAELWYQNQKYTWDKQKALWQK